MHTLFLTLLHPLRIAYYIFLKPQTTISVQFKPVSSVDKYELEYKIIEQGWDGAKSTTLKSDGTMVTGVATDLEPGMTYCMRVYCFVGGSKGAAGSELIIDTEQVGCTPQAEKSCCVIQ